MSERDEDDWYGDEDATVDAGGATDTAVISGDADVAEGADAGPTDEADPFAMAKDVTAHKVTFPEGFEVTHYDYPQVGTGFSLGGTEFWQKWAGGKNPTYSFGDGSDFGKRCMVASAKRFEAIMSSPPEALVALKADSNWSGSFFNWNDDYSQSDWGDGSSARLWAWKTHLIKWISQTSKDGSCFLPTLEMVETVAENCMSRADSNNGEIVGCKAP